MKALVIGSGPSGVHFARQALVRGWAVTMVDVGFHREPPAAPLATFDGLKTELKDPVDYFLGENLEGVALPGDTASFYQFPPSKAYVFRRPVGVDLEARSLAPLLSFASGGLAEIWTAGAYVWQTDDLASFPLAPEALTPHYATVAERVGITGIDDDLAALVAGPLPYLPSIPLDGHSKLLLSRYERRREGLRARHGFVMGRSRLAVLSEDRPGRPACSNLGRCLWGCPHDALYRPSVTLRECLEQPGFEYHDGHVVDRLRFDATGTVRAVETSRPNGEPGTTFTADVIVLAAGTLGTARIYLASVEQDTRLDGLMDNRQVHVPFLTPAQLGRPVETAAYQFHLLAFGLLAPTPLEYIHGQITTLRAASIHPIVSSLPVDYRTGLKLFRLLRAGLGIVNLNLADERRTTSHIRLDSTTAGRPRLKIEYVAAADEPKRRRTAVRRVRAVLRRLGCLVPPGLTRVLPMGASAHYAGTLPMSSVDRPHTTAPNGRVRGFSNLYAVDGSVMPSLSAKNHTLTLMANACRVADELTR